jgi:hypothetical protein
LQANTNASLSCDDWWDQTESSSNPTLQLALQVIKDVHLRQAILRA